MNSKYTGAQVEKILDRTFDSLFGFNPASLPYHQGDLCAIGGRRFEALRETRFAPLPCLTDKAGSYITTKDGEYIIIGDSVNPDFTEII